MSITKSKKELLIKFHNNICENCGNEFESKDLCIHRIIRGGNYEDHRILKVLCKFCHKRYHEKEYTN